MPKPTGPKARRGRPRKAKMQEEPQPEAVEETQSNGNELDQALVESTPAPTTEPTSPGVAEAVSSDFGDAVPAAEAPGVDEAATPSAEPPDVGEGALPADKLPRVDEAAPSAEAPDVGEAASPPNDGQNVVEAAPPADEPGVGESAPSADEGSSVGEAAPQAELLGVYESADPEELEQTDPLASPSSPDEPNNHTSLEVQADVHKSDLDSSSRDNAPILKKKPVMDIEQTEDNAYGDSSLVRGKQDNVKIKTDCLDEEEDSRRLAAYLESIKKVKEEQEQDDLQETEVNEGGNQVEEGTTHAGGGKEERRILDFDDEFESMETEESIYQTPQSPVEMETETSKAQGEEKLSEVFEQQEEFDANDKAKEHDLEDTEMVSEDELPSENLKPQLDTEAVSDEELPPNNAADHLLDTEAVSEDELPPVKKKKPRSSSGDSQEKKGIVEDEKRSKISLKRSASSNSESSDTVPSKKQAVETKPKALPELEKYWKAVREDPADFTGWTYLLQYVDQEHDVEAAREAYDTFLSHYPYCYGYWRKYADYEKRKGDKLKSQDVFERGLAAIPLSVDLWLHYLNHIKSTRKDDELYIREQYKRAVDVCGIEFRSDRLWDNYIKWETEGKNLNNVCAIYDRLFTIPTQNYKVHFENFEDFVSNNPPNKILGVDEFLTMRAEVLLKLKQKPPSEAAPAANAPPGDESDEDVEKSLTYADEETKLMREKIILSRKKIYKAMVSAINERWNFEEGIKRPYFHVKPLERCQLNNWRDYLDFEIAQGNKERTIILFERCLIACALYDEFWVKYLKYLETLTGDDVENKMRSVYERACTIHHPKKPMLSLNWAYFEENHGNIDVARKILCRIEKEIPNSLQIAICRINLERRDKNFDEASRLYEHYISTNKNKYATNALSIKYARFCQKIMNDIERGIEVLRKAIDKDKDNPRLYHQLLDLVFSKTPRGPDQESECLNIINQFLERETTDIEHKVLFAQHKIEFLEDFGSSATCVQKASAEYMSVLKQMKEKRRKQYEEKVKQEEKKKSESGHSTAASTSPGSTAVPTTASSYQSTYPSSGYQQTNTSGQYQSSSYGQAPYSQYNNQSDPNYNYQNWNYSQTGYNNYNQGWGSYNYY